MGLENRFGGGLNAAAVADGGVRRDDGVIRRKMGVMSRENPIVVVAQGWPCCLSTLLSFDLPVCAVFMAQQYWGIFSEVEKGSICKDLKEWSELDCWPADWEQHSVLASGSDSFLPMMVGKLKSHQGLFFYSTDVVFPGTRMLDLAQLYIKWTKNRLQAYGLRSFQVQHASFGGATSACHLISHREIADVDFTPTGVMRRVLKHCIDTTSSTFGVEVQEPTPLDSTIPYEAPICENG